MGDWINQGDNTCAIDYYSTQQSQSSQHDQPTADTGNAWMNLKSISKVCGWRGDRTVLYPNYGGEYMNLYIY